MANGIERQGYTMNRTAGALKIQLTDRFGWIFLPWIIISISFIVSLIIGGTSGDKIYTGGLSSIHIYMLIFGVINVVQSFPFAIGFSVRRKDFLLGTTLAIALVSLGSAILLWALGFIESELTGGWGVKLHFFNLPYISDSSAIGQIWTQLSLMLHMFMLGFVVSCIFRRFGRVGLYVFSISLFILFSVLTSLLTFYEKWKAIVGSFDGVSATELASGMFLVTLVYWLLSYLMLRRATV
jgi:hypothetical protein